MFTFSLLELVSKNFLQEEKNIDKQRQSSDIAQEPKGEIQFSSALKNLGGDELSVIGVSGDKPPSSSATDSSSNKTFGWGASATTSDSGVNNNNVKTKPFSAADEEISVSGAATDTTTKNHLKP
jgi:hypothetical protein